MERTITLKLNPTPYFPRRGETCEPMDDYPELSQLLQELNALVAGRTYDECIANFKFPGIAGQILCDLDMLPSLYGLQSHNRKQARSRQA
ncbi:hypothetical protein G6O67_006026 [Ophiocordyceps sinensis]|uniref:Uncharacterized protein n=2 Tax=Ophiocordyceps sinensis TaxID=72228 RepID=A0A8H4PNR5_9HYPO|nr:hypothetical protein OCS_04579 [Ophiocordyceps sinensis CO18]KAF4507384.1 hypothetical protein G6O67_006026 [Ophiocordyceps sinensis]